MKKSLSIILIVAMLLSMVMVAIPAAAAEEEIELPVKTWDEPWKEFSEDWVAIGTADEFINAFSGAKSGTHDNGHYYLTADIDLTNKREAVGNPYNITIDGNGHSITFGGSCQAVFGNPGNLTLQNLIIKGKIVAHGNTVGENSGAWNDVFSKWDHKGWVKAYNVVSAIDLEYNRMINGSQRPSGFISNCYEGSEFENIKFVGSISVGPQAMIARLGAIVSIAQGTTTFKNCTNDGAIIFAGKMAISGNSSSGDVQHTGIGGIAGDVAAGSTFENCTNNGTIFYSGFELYDVEADEDGKQHQAAAAITQNSAGKNISCYSYLGGIAGISGGVATFTNCYNKGTIMLGDTGSNRTFTYAGGIYGGLDNNSTAPVVMTNVHNSGNVIAVYPNTADIGGLVGILRNNAPNVFDNCSNSGNITSYNNGSRNTSFAAMGGLIGYAYGAYYPNYGVTFTDCSNSGNITSHAKGTANKEVWGGFIGHGVGIHNLYFENCVNSGDILMPKNRTSQFIEGSAGFVGGARTLGDNWASIHSASYVFKNCLNLGNVTGLQSGGFFGDNSEINVNADKDMGLEKFIISFENCVNAGNIDAKTTAGGLAAFVGEGGGFTVSVKNCSNGGTITAATCGGMFGLQTVATNTTVENFVNYGAIGTADNNKAAGVIGGSDGVLKLDGAINIGTVLGKSFDPFANMGIEGGEGNKYLISATIDDDFAGGEAVAEPEALIEAANAYNIPFAANCGAILDIIANCKAMDPSDYLVGADWDGLNAACEAAEAILTAEGFDPLAYTQAQANEIYLTILKSLVTVIEKADVSELNMVISEAKTKLVDGIEYTPATLKNLQDAIDAAEPIAALGENAKMTDVTEAIEDIQKAIDRLREVPKPIDYSALEEIIAEAEALVEAQYTVESWDDLKDALKDAKEALEAEKQTMVDGAVANLKSAVKNLKPLEAPQETDPTPSETPAATQPADNGGCGSVIGGAAVVLTAVIALGMGISLKKKED